MRSSELEAMGAKRKKCICSSTAQGREHALRPWKMRESLLWSGRGAERQRARKLKRMISAEHHAIASSAQKSQRPSRTKPFTKHMICPGSSVTYRDEFMARSSQRDLIEQQGKKVHAVAGWSSTRIRTWCSTAGCSVEYGSVSLELCVLRWKISFLGHTE